MGRSILITSGKGGSGRSTFAVAMAITLAKRNERVCLLDLNFGMRNLDIYLGLENNVIFDLGDIMSGICRVEKALVRHDKIDKLFLLECPQGKLIKGISETHIKALLRQLKSNFDYVIIDGPASIDKDLALAACAADSAVLVVTPEPVAVRNSDALDRNLQKSGVKSRCFVLNMVKPGSEAARYSMNLDEIAQVFEIPLAGMIPFDENIQIGNNAGNPVFLEENSYISKNISDIVTRMLG